MRGEHGDRLAFSMHAAEGLQSDFFPRVGWWGAHWGVGTISDGYGGIGCPRCEGGACIKLGNCR